MNKKIYLALTVYNYDASPRMQRCKHVVASVERARRIADGLRKLIGTRPEMGRTQTWLENHYHIYGFVERVDGIFVEETRRVA